MLYTGPKNVSQNVSFENCKDYYNNIRVLISKANPVSVNINVLMKSDAGYMRNKLQRQKFMQFATAHTNFPLSIHPSPSFLVKRIITN